MNAKDMKIEIYWALMSSLNGIEFDYVVSDAGESALNDAHEARFERVIEEIRGQFLRKIQRMESFALAHKARSGGFE